MSEKTDSKGNKPAMSHGDFVLRGAAIGLGTAGVVSMIRQALEAKRQRDRRDARESGGIGKDTIVLRVKRRKDGEEKAAEETPSRNCCNGKETKVEVKPCVECGEIKPTASGQPREVNGRFTGLPVQEKKAGLFREMAREGSGLFLGTGAAVGSFIAARKLFEKLEQNRLKAQIAAAQTEYLDLLDGKQVKGAEAFATMFMIGDDSVERVEKAAADAAGIEPEQFEKSAQVFTDLKYIIDNARPTTRHLGAAGVLMYLLGVTGSAYIAKKLMDQQFAENNEEPPHKAPRIVMKMAEAEFEVQPEQVLATIGIMRDCIADSTPEDLFMKKSAYDYGFLDELAKTEQGRKRILDTYAQEALGLNRGISTKSNGILQWLQERYWGKTIDSIRKNPRAHSDAIKSYMLNKVMKEDPKGWFELLGQDPELVKALADREIGNKVQGLPFLGWLARMFPGFGDFFAGIPKWWVNNTASGKRFLMDSSLSRMGVTPGERAAIMRGFSPNANDTGWTKITVQKQQPPPSDGGTVQTASSVQVDNSAQAQGAQQPKSDGGSNGGQDKAAEARMRKESGFVGLGDILALTSRMKTVTDTTNDRLYRKLEDMSRPKKKAGKKSDGDSGVSVKFDDELDKLLSEEDKKKILDSLSSPPV